LAVLVTGGARSGKSRFAEAYAMRLGDAGIYVATSQVLDEEMRERVERHRARRDGSGRSTSARFLWTTIEEPYELAAVLHQSKASVIMVDCLTLWLTNWLLRNEFESNCESLVMAKVDELAELLAGQDNRIILVTNEVGDGIVPEYKLGRQFRDLAGWMNQRIAAVCDEVFLVTAGIPVELKRIAYHFADGDRCGT
jgi:adenosylcobinamide kinase / adenosylcobinamide-phosphate guanylyltransferase